MKLVQFIKKHEYMGHTFEVDEVYDFTDHKSLHLKFVTYSGTAVPLDGLPEGKTVTPTPDFSAYKRPNAPVTPAPTSPSPIPSAPVDTLVEVEETSDTAESSESTDEEALDETEEPTYTLEHQGGPWFNVVDSMGVKVNKKPMTKTKAQELVKELVEKDSDTSD